MRQENTDSFSQPSKRLSSSESKMDSIEMGNSTDYVRKLKIHSTILFSSTLIIGLLFKMNNFHLISIWFDCLQRKTASASSNINDSPSSIGEVNSNNRSSSSVKILSNISLPPYRPSLSSQNLLHTQQTSQGNVAFYNSHCSHDSAWKLMIFSH